MASFSSETLPTPRKLSDLSSTIASAAAEPQSLADNVFDHDGIACGTGEKKPAWSKPSGSSAVEVGPVMGAVSWPALTKSAQASPKPMSSPSESSQDQPLGPLISSSSPKKTITSSQSPNSTKSHPASTRQKSGRRSAMVNGGTVPASDERLATEVALVEPGYRTNPNGDNGLPSGGADHNRSNVGSRRGSGGGNGSQRNRFGHRRDHNFGHRSFNGRDNHIQLAQHPRGGGLRPFPRPVSASVAAPIIGPHHLHGQPFRPMAGFHGLLDLNSPLYPLMPHQTLETYGVVSYLPQAVPAAMLLPAVDPSHALLRQIDYYFSTENLCKDIYLRQQMNDQGWVPISLIAGFNQVKQLTNNIHYIFDTVQYSTAVEVQGDKIRRRNDWMNWVLPKPNHFGSVSCPQSPAAPNCDTLGVHLQGLSLDKGDTDSSTRRVSRNTVVPISISGDSDEQSHVPPDTYGVANGQIYAHSDGYVRPTRSLSRSDTF